MDKYITLSHEVTSALHYMSPDMAEINFHAGHNAPSHVTTHCPCNLNHDFITSYSPGSFTHTSSLTAPPHWQRSK